MKGATYTGSYAWGKRTGGRLSFKETIAWSMRAAVMQVRQQLKRQQQGLSIDVHQIQLPDSRLVQQTLEYIADVHQPSLQNHCLRSFVLGEIFAQQEAIVYDREIYALVALLHDLGLEAQHCCLHKDWHCFAIEGAFEAGKFLEAQQLSTEKIKLVQESIALHLNLQIPKPLAEAYLLNKASGTDTINTYGQELAPAVRTAIYQQYPVGTMVKDLHQLLKKQSQLRPHSRMGFLYKVGFGRLLKKNPLLIK